MAMADGSLPRLEWMSMAGNDERDAHAKGKAAAAAPGAAQIDPRVQSEIGKHLRAAYDDVINEPVPQRFLDLLAKLEHSRKS